MAPRFEDAPGIVVRERADGTFSAWWQCRSDKARAGFVPRIVPLWKGVEPTDIDRDRISDACRQLQGSMLIFGQTPEATYDGTVRTLIHCYRASCRRT